MLASPLFRLNVPNRRPLVGWRGGWWSRRLSCGIVGSLVVHLAGLVALSQRWQSPRALPNASFAGRQQVIQLNATWSSLATSDGHDQPVQSTIVVLPHEAVIERQHFVTAATEIDLPEPVVESPFSTASAPKAPEPVKLTERSESKEPIELNHSKLMDRSPSESDLAPFRPAPKSTSASRPTRRQLAGTEVDQRPSFVNNRPPKYPESAVRHRWQGTVLLRLTIGRDGRVLHVAVTQSSGHSLLDAEAVQTVRHWIARPAMREGQPVETIEVLPIEFQLP